MDAELAIELWNSLCDSEKVRLAGLIQMLEKDRVEVTETKEKLSVPIEKGKYVKSTPGL